MEILVFLCTAGRSWDCYRYLMEFRGIIWVFLWVYFWTNYFTLYCIPCYIYSSPYWGVFCFIGFSQRRELEVMKELSPRQLGNEKMWWDFSGGPVVKTLCCTAGSTDLIPCQGIKIFYAVWHTPPFKSQSQWESKEWTYYK